MRNIALAVALAFALSGCALFSNEKLAAKEIAYCANANQTIQDACNSAVDMLEKADILASAINTGIDDSYNSKLLTKEQALGFRARTKQADAALDDAADAIRASNFTIALNKATVTKALLEALNREVAAEVAKAK